MEICQTCEQLDDWLMYVEGVGLCGSCAELTITAEITDEYTIIEDLEPIY